MKREMLLLYDETENEECLETLLTTRCVDYEIAGMDDEGLLLLVLYGEEKGLLGVMGEAMKKNIPFKFVSME